MLRRIIVCGLPTRSTRGIRGFSHTPLCRLLRARGPFGGTATDGSFGALTGRVQLDYAKSGRSNCSMCGFGILENSLRIGTNLQGAGDFAITVWQHPRCFRSMTAAIYPDLLAYTDADIAIKKIASVRPEDRDAVAKILTDDDACSWDKLLSGLFPLKSSEYAAFDSQLKATAAAQQALSEWSMDELRLIYDANSSSSKEGVASSCRPDRDVVAAKVSAILLFGPTSPCTACGGGELIAEEAGGSFACGGHFDAFTRCGARVEADAILRQPLVVPSALTERVVAFQKTVASAAGKKNAPSSSSRPIFEKQLVVGHIVKRAAMLWHAQRCGNASAQPPTACSAAAAASAAATVVDAGSIRYRGLTFVVDDDKAVLSSPPWDAVAAGGAAVVQSRKFFEKAPSKDNNKSAAQLVEWDGATHLVRDPSMPYDATAASTGAFVPTISTEWVLESAKVARPLCIREGYTFYKDDRRPPAVNTKWIQNAEMDRAPASTSPALSSAGAPSTPSLGTTGTSTFIFSGTAPVDPESGLAATHTVYHSASDLPYSVSLSSVDLGTDKNSFYVLQLLHDKDPASDAPYVLFRRWGRLGDARKGGTAHEKLRNAQTAMNKFAKYFTDRTDNDWFPYTIDHVKKFVKKPGKYNWLDRPHDEDNGGNAVRVSTPTVPVVGKRSKRGGKRAAATPTPLPLIAALPQETSDLMALLFSEDSIQRSMATMAIDTKKMPLPGLNSRAVKEGRAVLHELLQALQPLAVAAAPLGDLVKKKRAKGKKGKVGGSIPLAVSDVAGSAQRDRRVLSLSNQFYSHIPQVRDESADSYLLNTVEKIAPKFQLLDDLDDILLTKKLMLQQSTGLHDQRRAQYEQLRVDLVPISPKSDDEAKMIEKYFINSHGATHSKFRLQQVWKLSRHGEEDRYGPWKSFPNRKLLWHGSRLTNWVRILASGLKIAPPDAPATGYMFGKGVYFADMVSKSANYCHISSGSKDGGLLALAEVALGTPTIRYSSDYITSLPKGMHSTYARGRVMPDPAMDITLPSGLVIPSGDPIAQPEGLSKCALQYNEFIVYDVAQIRLKYLLHVTK